MDAIQVDGHLSRYPYLDTKPNLYLNLSKRLIKEVNIWNLKACGYGDLII